MAQTEPCGECHLKPGEVCNICGRSLKIERPKGSNADEWQLFLVEHKAAPEFLAVQIAESIEAAQAAIWADFVGRCESLEEEADRNLPGAEDLAKNYFRGTRYAAKSIRRSVEHPKYARR